MKPTICDLEPAHLADARRLLSQAFAADPYLVAALPDPRRRARALPMLFGAVLDNARQHGSVRVALDPGTHELAGVAAWAWWPHVGLGLLTSVRHDLATLPLVVGVRDTARLDRLNRTHEAAHRRLAPAKHRYLHAIGVALGHQGAGVGSALLLDGLADADAAGVATYLETHRAERAALRAVGYELVEELRPGGLHARCMLRPARQPWPAVDGPTQP